uniref:FAD dependent oxidoreductase domain-containing protein n=1 Tax=Acrobeloides nanus TaxID=290746 RepID=A0A914C4J6_9BILA
MDNLKIAIIGQGIIGVSSALAILEKYPNAQVTIFGDRSFEETCSYGPSGHFEVDRDVYKDWAKASFLKFAEIYRDHNPDVTGVKLISNFHISDTLEKLQNLERCTKEFVYNLHWLEEREIKAIFSQPKKYCLFFTAYASEGKKYVPWLKEKCVQKGAKFLAEEVDVIINCAGSYAGKLAGDDEVIPVKGVALEVYAPWHKHTYDYDCHTYAMPMGETVFIGTTRKVNCHSTKITDEERQDIMSRYEEFHPAMKNAKVVGEWCGIRGERAAGICRLESQKRTLISGKQYQVIHNYGHGGYGFILHWGCALKVIELLGC